MLTDDHRFFATFNVTSPHNPLSVGPIISISESPAPENSFRPDLSYLPCSRRHRRHEGDRVCAHHGPGPTIRSRPFLHSPRLHTSRLHAEPFLHRRSDPAHHGTPRSSHGLHLDIDGGCSGQAPDVSATEWGPVMRMGSRVGSCRIG